MAIGTKLWADLRDGFGDISSSGITGGVFFVGMETLSVMSQDKDYGMYIRMTYDDTQRFTATAFYDVPNYGLFIDLYHQYM